MGYLIPNDYNKQIQTVNLGEVTGSYAYQQAAELAAQAELTSYLAQKFDVASEFTNTVQYDPTVMHGAADRVYLNANAYSATSTYALNAITLQAGAVYICIIAITVPEVFNPAHWTLLGNQYDLFYAIFPFPVFNLLKDGYNIGDQVFWKGKIYKSIVQTVPLDHITALQYGNTNNLPFPNIFPDDPNFGSKYWALMSTYVVPAGSLLNPIYWIKGDNRNQQMVMYAIDITLYHIHSRIAPRNIPNLRTDRYNAAINWLTMVMKGHITPGLTVLQPPSGNRIRFGTNIKNINSY